MSEIPLVREGDEGQTLAVVIDRLERMSKQVEALSTRLDATNKDVGKIMNVLTLGRGGWLTLAALGMFILWLLGLFDKAKPFIGVKTG